MEKGRGEGSKQKGETREREDAGDKTAVLTVLTPVILFVGLGTGNNSSPGHRGSHKGGWKGQQLHRNIT